MLLRVFIATAIIVLLGTTYLTMRLQFGPNTNSLGPTYCIAYPGYACNTPPQLNASGELSGTFSDLSAGQQFNVSFACVMSQNATYNLFNEWQTLTNFTTLKNNTVISFTLQCYQPNGAVVKSLTESSQVQGYLLIRSTNFTTKILTNKVVFWFGNKVK